MNHIAVTLTFNGYAPVAAKLGTDPNALPLPKVIPFQPEGHIQAYTAQAGLSPFEDQDAPRQWLGFYMNRLGETITDGVWAFLTPERALKWAEAGADLTTVVKKEDWMSVTDVYNGGISYVLKLGGENE